MENENAIARPVDWVGRFVTVTETAAAKPRTWVKKLVKVLGRVSVAALALYVVASVTWRFSGSNQWEFDGVRNGVNIYTLKTSGTDLIQVKGVVRVNSTLGGIMKLAMDPATCDDYGCHETRDIARVDDWLQYSSFQINLPAPFQAREFVVMSKIHQNSDTKEILMEFVAAPDKAPPNDCCFRVTDMNNSWRLTPLGNGQVEVEYIQNMDEGGYIPDLLLNIRRPKLVATLLSKLQGMLNKKNYQNARLDYIQEK